MPRRIVTYECQGCDEQYEQHSGLWFDNCYSCNIEICSICGNEYIGKNYCNNCKPIETNYFERSVE